MKKCVSTFYTNICTLIRASPDHLVSYVSKKVNLCLYKKNKSKSKAGLVCNMFSKVSIRVIVIEISRYLYKL